MGHVEWQEIRNGEPFFVTADITADGWRFEERSTYEVRWFTVPAKAGWIDKAEGLLRKSTGSVASAPSTGSVDFEVGDFADNASVLVTATWRIRSGDVAAGMLMLTVLRNHVVSSPDPKSQRILLPAINDAMLSVISDEPGSGYTSSSTDRRQPERPVHEPVRGAIAVPDGSTRVARFKSHLVDAAVVVTALSWTHGLLVHDVMALPLVADSPVGANILAGSLLATALRFVSRSA